MQAQRAGEQAVAEGNLKNIVLRRSRGDRDARHLIRPVVEILLGVCAHRRLSRCAGRSVDAHDLLHRLSQHAEGIIVPDIILGGKRDVLDIGKRLDLISGYAGLFQPVMIEGDILIAVIHHPLEAFQLERFNFRAAHGFNFFLEKHSNTSVRLPMPQWFLLLRDSLLNH